MTSRFLKMAVLALVCLSSTATVLRGQTPKPKIEPFDDKFRQLEEILPTANSYRTASGAPGHEYWQQQADYKIKAELTTKTNP